MQLRDQWGRLDTLDLFKLVTFLLIGKHLHHKPVLSGIVCSWKLVGFMVQVGRCKMLIYKVTSKWFRTDRCAEKTQFRGTSRTGIFTAIVLEHSSLWIPAVYCYYTTLARFQDCSFQIFLDHVSHTVRPSGTSSIVLLASTSVLFLLSFLSRQGAVSSVGLLLEPCHVCSCASLGNLPSAP